MTASTFRPAPLAQQIGLMVLILAAILGVGAWLGRLWPGAVIYLTGCVLVNIIRAILTRGAPLAITGGRQDKLQNFLVKFVGVGGFALPILTVWTPWLDFAHMPLPVWALGLGSTVLAASLWLFWRSHVDLGQFWSPVLETREGHQLVTQGVYQRVRNPMYTAIFGIGLAQLLLMENGVSGPSGVLAFGLLYLQRIGPEEAMMEAQFGEDWRAYLGRSGRLWPRLG